jgi:alkanesulfonate monooxygenase SsuD/methylene tetrahydromethanopterin reductase-like flavin-dependent oxidoreductase (luciferase family)
MREWGTGWIPMVATLEELSRTIAKMQDEVADAGRDPEDLVFAYHLTYGERDPYHSAAGESVAHATAAEPVVTSAEQAIEMVARYGAVGVNRIEVRFRWDRGPEQLVEGLQRFSEEVMPYTAAL